MKLRTIETTSQIEQPITNRIRKVFNKNFANLKGLFCDVFEKATGEKYYIYEGKRIKSQSSRFSPRELPNCVTGPTDWQGITSSKVEFYPADIEKMKTMNIDERLAYKRKLIELRRFKLEEPPKSDNL